MFDSGSSLDNAFVVGSAHSLRGLKLSHRKNAGILHFDKPPSLEDVRNNITNYLYLIHKRLGALAGPNVEAEDIWREFFEVSLFPISQSTSSHIDHHLRLPRALSFHGMMKIEIDFLFLDKMGLFLFHWVPIVTPTAQ
jgi:hypothetical protein